MAAGGKPELAVTFDASDFHRLFGKSSQVGPVLRAALRKRIRVAANTAADAARTEARGTPGTVAKAAHHTGLRDRIAAAIVVKIMTGIKSGVTISASSSKMPAGQATLVRGWEAAKGFRHRLFGDPDHWYTQKGRPYFRAPIYGRRATVQAAVEAAMADAIASLK
jgi:hypothetical protein